MLCEKCNVEFDVPDCPCTWVSYYGDSTAGYNLASVGDIPVELHEKISYSISNNRDVIFYGVSGSGKTHTSISEAKFFANEREVEFKVLSKFQDIVKYLEVPILVINELTDSMYDLIEERHAHNRITLASTNLISTDKYGNMMSHLDKRYTEWRFDCYCLPTPLSRNWIDNRRIEKQKRYDEWLEKTNPDNSNNIDINFLIEEPEEIEEEV